MTTDAPRRPTRTPGRPQRARAAFTLAEGLIASVVLAIAVVGIVTLVSASTDQADAVRQEAAALSLARELLEEAAGVPFRAAGGLPIGFAGGNADRATYNDLLDFAGYADDVAVGNGDTFARAVSVDIAPAGAAVATADAALVTVTVTPPRGRAIVIARLVTTADPARDGG